MIEDRLTSIEKDIKSIKVALDKFLSPEKKSSSSFEQLRDLLFLSDFPLAVDPDHITEDNNKELFDSLIRDSVKDKKFLDFGCENKLCVNEASARGASISVGYDKQTSWEDVRSKAPYDIVLLNDVLDHAVISPIEVLKQVKTLCSSETLVAVRCHPWSSRSATHIYTKVNKAFIHLMFSRTELNRLQIDPGKPTIHVIHPHDEYRGWIDIAGFKILNEDITTHPVEGFFKDNALIAERIKENWAASPDPSLANGESFPDYQLGLVYIDYRLKIV